MYEIISFLKNSQQQSLLGINVFCCRLYSVVLRNLPRRQIYCVPFTTNFQGHCRMDIICFSLLHCHASTCPVFSEPRNFIVVESKISCLSRITSYTHRQGTGSRWRLPHRRFLCRLSLSKIWHRHRCSSLLCRWRHPIYVASACWRHIIDEFFDFLCPVLALCCLVFVCLQCRQVRSHILYLVGLSVSDIQCFY